MTDVAGLEVNLKEGAIIEGPFWPEPVEIKKIEEIGEYIHIIGATIYSKNYIDQLIHESEREKIKTREIILNFSSDSSKVFLVLEAIRYKFASLFDPLLAMNVSKIDPLPFQIEAVYGYILKLPKIRFLIADDPGAGKTIMAGLIIKELKLRGLVHRILIVVPGHLKDQWIRELKEKFQETFTYIDRNFFNAIYGENSWQKENQVITSIDFAKQEDILPSLRSVFWDIVVVDEAHKMAAYRYGDKQSKTERYKLGEVLSKTTKNLLFLTATPHKGNPENFRLFLDLLEPGFFANPKMIEESLKNRDNPLFIRRLKEDLKNFDGKPIFTNRFSTTIKFRLSDKEKLLYNELSEYVISQYNKALQIDKRRNVAFALLILQRRMASSTYALFKSLQRRKKKLEELLKYQDFEKKNFLNEPGGIEDYDEEVEDYDEKERWEKEEKWETLTVAQNKGELEKEIKTVSKLMEKAIEILNNEHEVKLNELKKAIEKGLKKIREFHGNEKILVFTESRDTLEYLVEKIKSWGYSVNFIHGGMSLDDRISAEKVFRDEKQILVATEAAGEGINLQFCHIMINYDIPWNPNRLEQRMGRIHRYGQQKEVFMFNLVAEDTREGEVLSKILDKLEEIRNALGSDKVFDVIGDVFYGKNLYQLILDAVANARTLDEIIKELDIKVDEEYINKIKETLGESLATRYIDYTGIKEMAEKAKEYRLIPEYVEEFFKKAFEKVGGKYKIRKDGFISIESIPHELKKIADDFNFKNKYGILSKSYPKATFDKEIAFKNPDAEFISFGHPLLEALIEWINKNYLESCQLGAVFEDPSGRYNGVIWFFEGEVKDGKTDTAGKSIMAIYQDDKGLKEVNPSVLWDLVPQKPDDGINIKFTKEQAQEYAIKAVENYKKKILEERTRQANIKKKYGIKSLEDYMYELEEEICSLEDRKDKGEDVDIAIRNKQEQIKRYEEALKKLKKEIEQEVNLTISMPKFLGAVFVKPSSYPEMVSDEEIERIGMETAMKYEKEQGREPEDVSKENLGFDIRSKGKDEIRYIEVKARKDEGEIALTPNEWFKAKRFKENYWLYVVSNATTSPTLYIINNPFENLEPQEKIEVVRFVISSKEWKNKGKKV